MFYQVITEGNPLEVWAKGFWGDAGKAKAEARIKEGYWHRHMYEKDKHKTLAVVPENATKDSDTHG